MVNYLYRLCTISGEYIYIWSDSPYQTPEYTESEIDETKTAIIEKKFESI